MVYSGEGHAPAVQVTPIRAWLKGVLLLESATPQHKHQKGATRVTIVCLIYLIVSFALHTVRKRKLLRGNPFSRSKRHDEYFIYFFFSFLATRLHLLLRE